MADKSAATYHPYANYEEWEARECAGVRLMVLLTQRTEAAATYVTDELDHRVKLFERVRRETVVGGNHSPTVDATNSVINDILEGRL